VIFSGPNCRSAEKVRFNVRKLTALAGNFFAELYEQNINNLTREADGINLQAIAVGN
jgi:hypothetical protein